MSKPEGTAHYKKSIALDALGAVAIGVYIAMSFRGPLPLWVQGLYFVGCVMGGAATYLRGNYFSLACFAVMGLVTMHQIASLSHILN